MAMDVEPFYYLRVDDVVPEDAVYLVIGGLITEVPDGAFEYHENLERVEFREGVEGIGQRAFAGCPNLTHVDGASSLRTIGDNAFYWCEQLWEVILREGLRRIGERAFLYCALEQIAVPSSVVEIGDEAFQGCLDLETVKLVGGTVLVAGRAFDFCPRLERISISSMAIVVEEGEDGNGRTAVVTGVIERDPSNESSEPPRLILTSPHLVSMPPEDLTDLKEAIDQMVDTTEGAGPLDPSDIDVSDQVRDCFIDRLSTWYGWYKNEVAATLELGLWKIELSRTREMGRGQGRATGGGKRADVPTRDDSRRTCGADPIVGLVLSSLAGPHRRVDHEGNEPI